ncbi:hypothetical protein BGP_5085 [Beggiatoa sp. PS]|nr:hypothetical protein BGP_5085 [Beggiatoa sp. PS]
MKSNLGVQNLFWQFRQKILFLEEIAFLSQSKFIGITIILETGQFQKKLV